LRDTVRELTRRTTETARDYESRAAKLRAQFQQAAEREREQAAKAVEAEKGDTAVRRSHIETFSQARNKRIGKATQNSRERKLAQIESEEGRRTFEIQRDLLEAERKRDEDLKYAKSTLEAFNARLAGELASLQRTELRAKGVLSPHRSLANLLTHPPETKPDLSAHENQLADKLHEAIATANRELSRCQSLVLPVLFRVPVWVWMLLALAVPFAFVPALRQFDLAAVPTNVWAIMAGSVVGLFVLFVLSRQLAAPAAKAAAIALENARKLYDSCAAKGVASHAAALEQARLQFTSTQQMLNNNWKAIQAEARSLRKEWTTRFEDQTRKLHTANQDRAHRQESQLAADHATRMEKLVAEAGARRKALEAAHHDNLAKLNATNAATRQAIDAEWRTNVIPLFEQLQAARLAAEELFPPWRAELWSDFTPPEEFAQAARFGELQVDLEKLCGVEVAARKPPLPLGGGEGRGEGATSAGDLRTPSVPGRPLTLTLSPSEGERESERGASSALTLPGEKQFTLPLLLSIPDAGSLLFETKTSGHEQIIGDLNSIVLRLLTSAPPGRLAFTIFDPVGLGQNFAGIMHLADFEERVINSRIWTQQAQFEQRLADLNEHIEKVTQMYLRNEYASLAEYNAQAGRLAEKYQFLVIADFPVNFSDVAVKRLQSIIASGPRCGVFTLIYWDQRRPAPVELVPDELRKNSLRIMPKGDSFGVAGADWDGIKLTLDAPPDAELATQLLQQIGKASVDSYRVEMPFVEVAPEDNEVWSLDTTSELRVPIGRTGATKLQYLALGQGTRQHGLVAGKTGSGKSTLFHVIITNLSLWCSPDQVEFYLVDFKKGVEFKTYATHKLPHARVIAIESDREFGLSVLQRVDEELKRRGDLFRKLGAQDIAGYKRAGGNEPMPRVLLLIDEFQELFVEDDRVSQGAALLLDRIVRQGRAFGIHVLLGSQTLGGAYTLARATIGQMVVRVALQCNEADAYLIMNEDNPAPRLLSRPGEAIYNDEGGAVQGNSPFQIVWLPDQVRDEWLGKVRSVTERRAPPRREPGDQRAETVLGAPREPIVFEGNAPANVRDNIVLRALLDADKLKPTVSPRVFLGAPNSIKGPTEAVFHRQSGNHLLIAGQRDEAALGMVALSLISLAAQHAKNSARFFVFDCSPPDSAEARLLERIVRSLPHETKLVSVAELPEVMTALEAEMNRRMESPDAAASANYLLIHGLPQNKKLRFDEEASFSLDPAAGAGNPGLILNKLICEGASLGFHVIATCDTYNNVMRMLSRKALSEFEMRVVFQMSANDSASLIESPAANNLGLHRAILYNGQQGWMETFRPYALPEEGWLAEVGNNLTRLGVAP